MSEMVVNGKVYPLWSQFVERKGEWIGGTLRDEGDVWDRALLHTEAMETEITDITLEPNGKDSAFFSIRGKDFDCGFDVQHGGISGNPDALKRPAWLAFSGYGEHRFQIKKKGE